MRCLVPSSFGSAARRCRFGCQRTKIELKNSTIKLSRIYFILASFFHLTFHWHVVSFEMNFSRKTRMFSVLWSRLLHFYGEKLSRENNNNCVTTIRKKGRKTVDSIWTWQDMDTVTHTHNMAIFNSSTRI